MKEIENIEGRKELIAETAQDFEDLLTLRYLIAYTSIHEYPPTRREIKKARSYSSTSVVTACLLRLQEYEALKITPMTNRGIKLCVDSTLPPIMNIKKK